MHSQQKSKFLFRLFLIFKHRSLGACICPSLADTAYVLCSNQGRGEWCRIKWWRSDRRSWHVSGEVRVMDTAYCIGLIMSWIVICYDRNTWNWTCILWYYI